MVTAHPLFASSGGSIFIYLFIFQMFSLLFLEREEGGERGRNIDGRETLIDCLPHTRAGIKAATQLCALDRESNPRPFDAWANVLTIENPDQGYV